MRSRHKAWRSLLVILAGTIALHGAVAPAQEEESAPEKVTIPVFELGGVITETPMGQDLLFSSGSIESLKSLVERLQQARDDEDVPAIVILWNNASIGIAQIEELRRVMQEIEDEGKEIYVHADGLTTVPYVLLSGATRLVVVPTGDVQITGIYGESPYLRGLFDLIGVQPDFITCGDYKSAGEMFMRRGPSPEAQENIDWLMDGIFATYIRLIAEGRDVAEKTAKDWIDEGLYSAERAVEAGIIDDTQFRQDFVATLHERYGEDAELDRSYAKKSQSDIDLSSPFGLLKFYAELLAGSGSGKSDEDSIAIIYVEGPILPGSGGGGGLLSLAGEMAYSTPIRRALDEAARDDSIKGVVLRVNSPGGSAVASEIILNATRRVAAVKPFVVSMGDVAGSGGYYVACGAETIYADASTITGSIGVVSGKLATEQMWDKVGITWAPTERGANAGLMSSAQPFTDSEREQLQAWMNEIYEVFKGHVVSIRGDRLTKDIEELAGGRVYSGSQALELGLVDRIGGLDDAVRDVAEQAGLEEYEVRVLPQPKSFLEMLLGDLDGDEELPTLGLAGGRRASLIERALPHLHGLEEERVRSILASLRMLEVMQQDGAMLAMPVIRIAD